MTRDEWYSNRFFLSVTLIFLVVLSVSCHSDENARTIGVMTFNIRYDNPSDGVHRWDLRKDWVGEIINTTFPDIVGIQEALRHQLDSLAVRLPEYQWTGVGRSDGLNSGEFSPIFYRADRLVLQDGGTFWLSDTPDSTGSVGWDAALPRIVTWGRFLNLRSGDSFYAFNTHFDHRGVVARLESAKLIVDRVLQIAGSSPYILTGDFNFQDSSPAYTALLDDGVNGTGLTDSRSVAEMADIGTFRGFETGSTEPRTIDYIFVSPDVIPTGHRVLDESRDGRYPSDHLPVYATVELPAMN